MFQAPATLFLAAGPMHNGCAYWWDELADLVFDPPPIRGCMTVGQRSVYITLGRAEKPNADLTG